MPPETTSTFGPRLRQLRQAAHMTGAELAEAVGTSRQLIHEMEMGRSQPTWAMVLAIAEALGCSTDAFREQV